MPRKLRIKYPGAMYHLMSRSDRGERTFLGDVYRHDLIKTLAGACRPTNHNSVFKMQTYEQCGTNYGLTPSKYPRDIRLVEPAPSANPVMKSVLHVGCPWRGMAEKL